MAVMCIFRGIDCLATTNCALWNDADNECYIKTIGRYAYGQLNP